jgi:predicted HTH transcriptional regulator
MTCTENSFFEKTTMPILAGLNLQGHSDDPVNEGVTGYALNERQRWFLQQLQLGHRVSPDEIAQHWKNWKKSVATVERDIAGLRKQNLIEFVGAPKTGHYRIKPAQVEG